MQLAGAEKPNKLISKLGPCYHFLDGSKIIVVGNFKTRIDRLKEISRIGFREPVLLQILKR